MCDPGRRKGAQVPNCVENLLAMFRGVNHKPDISERKRGKQKTKLKQKEKKSGWWVYLRDGNGGLSDVGRQDYLACPDFHWLEDQVLFTTWDR